MLLSRNCFTYAQSKERNEMSASDCCLLEEVQRGERKREREHIELGSIFIIIFLWLLFSLSLTHSLTGHTSGVVCSSGIGWVRSKCNASYAATVPFSCFIFCFLPPQQVLSPINYYYYLK